MNYISKVFCPRANLTRLNEEDIAETIPPMNFENLSMEQTVKPSIHQITRIYRSGPKQH